MSRRLIAFGVVATALLATAPLLADTLYTQPQNYADAFEADSGERNAENFTLNTSGLISGISWDGFASFTTPTTFTVSFYNTSAGLPGSVVATYDVTPTSVVDSGNSTVYDPSHVYENYLYTATLPDTLLYGSTEYWISISADGLGTDPYFWFWGTGSGGPGDGFAFASPVSDPFAHSSTSEDLSVTLTGTVVTPEPASLALVGTGMLGIAGMMRRRFVRA